MSDSRFSALSSDPRYRLPSRKEARTAVDPRFKTLFTDKEFSKKAKVDRYGRKIKPETGKKDLERLYRLDEEEKPKSILKKKVERDVVGSSDESEEDEEDGSDEEEDSLKERDPARDGFSESESSEEETSDEDEEDNELELAEATAGQEQTEDIPMGDVSRRIACVNLDWDNIRAADLMAVAQSFAPTGGKVRNVTIYPSEFGRERLEREEIEGPPREIFASSSSKKKKRTEEEDESSDDDEKIKQKLLQQQASEGDEFDTAKLRQYQLERLRYYYAVIECDGHGTAKMIYDAMDGREYLSTSNFFDLRFVPDDKSFKDDEPHDECNDLPRGYKPNDFRTEALTHSRVRLTWDDDDATRKEVQKRAFSRAEMDENDLQAYIGSDDSDADSTTSRKSSAEDKKAKKKEAQRATMREALGLPAEGTASSKKGKDEPVGDMQITFTSGLAGNGKEGKGVFENEPQDEESTRERYIRKEKERKQKRKERMKAGRNGVDEEEEQVVEAEAGANSDDNDPFNDPFFNDPEAAKKQEKAAKKAARQAKIDAKAATDAEAEARRGELELLMAEEDADVRHFDMREIEKAQKEAKRAKHNKKKGKKEVEKVQDDFKVETEDPRFSKLFDSHEYAIDPTNPRFKQTEGMKTLLEEGRKKRKVEDDDVGEAQVSKKVRKGKGSGDVEAGGEDVKGLVARLKNKNKSKAK
ncbi:Pre-rRNA-processing protein esf1 [Fulvia fulva]|uniref:Pre-rRNA-processing protein esf1 n=1 Tax=Passalora fulva TaxID=5499 RepID=A0A9Q8PE28_PASFU|nr:Pre-rRNA-processing protein esf1 [Fulvia fulva]KAK4618145.1 Pre-rRNA-processing protein esf1 [Fulvia fulva]KAK4619232.1 Pre-rRNA-processing protein esf1 [Fulvia fulva]UJO20707.1 Pre-rRNA-processing protein esf1 [Fulvia fulva]WPV18365.1 Pre-rRNA-processing protein esf1 [Fulvia fulva]WPV33047.1 Pre-rRNA-processing protein esf1 [Fulvia fulva]